MNVLKNLVLISCLMTADLNSKAVSFAVRNLSGAPIVDGVWKWNPHDIYEPAGTGGVTYYGNKAKDVSIKGVTPIAPGALQGWAWDNLVNTCQIDRGQYICKLDKVVFIQTVNFIREEIDQSTGKAIRQSSNLVGEFKDNWDFALLPGGKIIQLRHYYNTTIHYVHPNFQTLYQGQIQTVQIPRVIMQDGKTYFGNVKQVQQPAVLLQNGQQVPGIYKQTIKGNIVLEDGTQLDPSLIKEIKMGQLELPRAGMIPGRIKERKIVKFGRNNQFSEEKVIIESSKPEWNNQELRPSDIIREISGAIIMKDGKEYASPIKQNLPSKIVMQDGKEYQGEFKQQLPGKVVMDENSGNATYEGIIKEIIPGKVVFTDGTVVLADGTVTR